MVYPEDYWENLYGKDDEYVNQVTIRYIVAEQLLLEIAEMKWYKRIFIRKRIMKYLKDTLEEYNY